MARHASCHCGTLVLAFAGEPAKVSQCHCYECQRRTGSLFSVAAFYPRESVTTLSGTSHSYTRPSSSGFPVTFHFCPDCGSSVWWEPERMPRLIGVAVGCFADRNFRRPDQAVWVAERHGWLDIPDDIPQHEANPVKR